MCLASRQHLPTFLPHRRPTKSAVGVSTQGDLLGQVAQPNTTWAASASQPRTAAVRILGKPRHRPASHMVVACFSMRKSPRKAERACFWQFFFPGPVPPPPLNCIQAVGALIPGDALTRWDAAQGMVRPRQQFKQIRDNIVGRLRCGEGVKGKRWRAVGFFLHLHGAEDGQLRPKGDLPPSPSNARLKVKRILRNR